AANRETVRTEGGASGRNRWEGNYWDEYLGVDLDGDGVGELPFRLRRWFESASENVPVAGLLHASPGLHAVELAARTFPLFAPQQVLVDPRPLVRPAVPPEFVEEERSAAFAASSLGIASLGLGVMWRVRRPRSREVAG
ncbi:MAG: hypothetical protein QN140_05670, partial [Armatimonadota bacterium]|nr:hypothetical protein [Armatimonadota bacterium]